MRRDATADELRARIAALRADIDAQRQSVARINRAIEPRLEKLNRLLADLALCESGATHHGNGE